MQTTRLSVDAVLASTLWFSDNRKAF